jgi:hypothetical protein
MRALLDGIALALALASPARADGCPASSVDVADWPIVRSARVPGFTLRLPRSFTRDSATTAVDSTPIARWTDAARGRFTLSHHAAGATAALEHGMGERGSATRCEVRVGSATATIVSYGEGANAYVVHARIRWPDGEAIDVRADATDREHLDLLLAAVRTVRRAGA